MIYDIIVFSYSPLVNEKLVFSKIFTLRAFLKRYVFSDCVTRYVWTVGQTGGEKYPFLFGRGLRVFGLKNSDIKQ